MACFATKTDATIHAFILAFLFYLSAARVMTGEQKPPVPARRSMAMQRAPVPPSGKNPCSFIPGLSHGHCKLSDVEDVAGGGGFPHLPADGFAAASMANQTQKQEP